MNNTQFGFAYLAGVDFTGAQVQGVQFGGAVLVGANFGGAKLSVDPNVGTNSGFASAFLQGAQLGNATLEGTSLANAFLDFNAGAAVALDDRLHPLEVAGEERPQRLGVELLAELGRPGDVAEEDGDDLALLACCSCGTANGVAAARAEGEVVRAVASATRAERHAGRGYDNRSRQSRRPSRQCGSRALGFSERSTEYAAAARPRRTRRS